MLAVSNFFDDNFDDPFVLGAFFGFYKFTDDNTFIYTQSTYKKVKFVTDNIVYENSKLNYTNILNYFSITKNWTQNNIKSIKRAEFIFALNNDLKLNTTSFFNKLYTKILLLHNTWNKSQKDNFVRAFFELRGSIDLKANYLAMDYFYNSQQELKRFRILTDFFNINDNFLNINFRELQKQFVEKQNKRNTQFRINLQYYIKNFGIFNTYKVEILKTMFKIITSNNNCNEYNYISYFDCEVATKKDTSIEQRIKFYTDFIYENDLAKFDIKLLRKELNFDESENNDTTNKIQRNQNIIKIFTYGTKDECAACKNKYSIDDRSFKRKNNPDRYYLEIHHCISLGKNKELDVLENLTKLCPTCHRALSKNSSAEEHQKNLISEILNNNENNLEFAKIIFDNTNFNYLVNKIYEHLK